MWAQHTVTAALASVRSHWRLNWIHMQDMAPPSVCNIYGLTKDSFWGQKGNVEPAAYHHSWKPEQIHLPQPDTAVSAHSETHTPCCWVTNCLEMIEKTKKESPGPIFWKQTIRERVHRERTDGDRLMGMLETDDSTGIAGLPTWCDSTDLYIRVYAIFLRRVKDRAEMVMRWKH